MGSFYVLGILQSSNYEPNDVFWGQLAGCMECINAGTTTVVDHSHLNYSEEARTYPLVPPPPLPHHHPFSLFLKDSVLSLLLYHSQSRHSSYSCIRAAICLWLLFQHPS